MARPRGKATQIEHRRPVCAALATVQAAADKARAFAQAARADRTRSAYEGQWRTFVAWCDERALQPFPAEPATLALYLTDRASAGIKPASLDVAVAAITAKHRAGGVAADRLPHKHPQVADIRRGIRRSKGTAPRRVAPVMVDELRRMTSALPDSLIGKRDRALLVVGFAGALRRSELVALDVDAVEFGTDGLTITIRRSKTDQEGKGARIGLPFGSDPDTCPVRTLRAWLESSGVAEGPVFRAVSRYGQVRGELSGLDVARIVKRNALAAGLDPSRFAGHSLRAGLATQAAKNGKTDRAIMRQGRWAGRAMVDRYVRDARLLDGDNAAAGIGL
jgi:integrase